MTKTQINCVALVIQLRMLGPRSFDKVRDALHFFVVLRNQTFEPFPIVKETRFSFLSYESTEPAMTVLTEENNPRGTRAQPAVQAPKRSHVAPVPPGRKTLR